MNLFTFMVALMSLFSFALALPANVEVAGEIQELTVVYHRVNSNTTVEVLSSDGLVGQACSASLNSGSFAKLPIIFDVDDRGSGNLTVGPSTYRIHEDIKHSGGIICGRMFNNVEAAISCTVTVTAALPLQPLSELEVTECISKDFYGLANALQAAVNPSPGPTDPTRVKVIATPPNPPDPHCSEVGKTEVVGDGDPHQNYYRIQLSGTTNCAEIPNCSIAYHDSKGVTVSYTASAKVEDWIPAGFSVQEKWTTGTEYSCDAKAGETVCVWYNVAHTAYTVRNVYIDRCDGMSRNGDPLTLLSPNQANTGGGEYCVIGPCRHQGDWWWDYSGPADGPDA